MDVREVLVKMLDILQEKEWIQGNLYKYNDIMRHHIEGVCLEGACNLAVDTEVLPLRAQGFLRSAVNASVLDAAAYLFPEKTPPWATAMFQFNDYEGVSREDVILTVKTAIERLDSSS